MQEQPCSVLVLVELMMFLEVLLVLSQVLVAAVEWL
jgi:hypothetical protein